MRKASKPKIPGLKNKRQMSRHYYLYFKNLLLVRQLEGQRPNKGAVLNSFPAAPCLLVPCHPGDRLLCARLPGLEILKTRKVLLSWTSDPVDSLCCHLHVICVGKFTTVLALTSSDLNREVERWKCGLRFFLEPINDSGKGEVRKWATGNSYRLKRNGMFL